MIAEPEVFARREIREAIALLREYGVTADQYATVSLIEQWHVGNQTYPSRDAAFEAAQREANQTGEWAEVSLVYGEEADWAMAESWIVEPGR